MDLFAQVVHNFTVIPFMDSWQAAQSIFQQAAARRPIHWLLPVRACEAVGGSPEQAIPAIVAVGCAHVGILLVDDMLDADPRGEYHNLGMPACANLACAFQSAALYAIGLASPDPTAKSAALDRFNAMFLSTTFGQFLDASARMLADEDSYWRVTQTKSSPFFGAALYAGALAGGGTLQTSEQLNHLGCLYGEMIQIHDDMHDSMETPANPDWVQGRSPLPILFASLVNHPEQQHFLELSRRISEPDALQEAQEIIIRCGAISYCADQLLRKHQSAKKILDGIALLNYAPITSLLDEVIAPVYRLLEATER
jgi:geranylgeranyl diphosphate synthase type I